MQEEMENFNKNGTRDLHELLKGRHALTVKWIYK